MILHLRVTSQPQQLGNSMRLRLSLTPLSVSLVRTFPGYGKGC